MEIVQCSDQQNLTPGQVGIFSIGFICMEGKSGNILQAEVGKELKLLSLEQRVEIGLDDSCIKSAEISFETLREFLSRYTNDEIFTVTDIRVFQNKVVTVTFSEPKGDIIYWHDLKNFVPVDFDKE